MLEPLDFIRLFLELVVLELLDFTRLSNFIRLSLGHVVLEPLAVFASQLCVRLSTGMGRESSHGAIHQATLIVTVCVASWVENQVTIVAYCAFVVDPVMQLS